MFSTYVRFLEPHPSAFSPLLDDITEHPFAEVVHTVFDKLHLSFCQSSFF